MVDPAIFVVHEVLSSPHSNTQADSEIPLLALGNWNEEFGESESPTGEPDNPTVAGRWRDKFDPTASGTKRAMQSRHLMMIAIGGTIGTGIFLSSGTTIALAGPGGALIAYILVGIFVYAVMHTLCEMTTMYPVSGAFSVFGTRFVSPAFGFTLGWNYWLLTSLYISSELTAAVGILQYWAPQSRPWHWAMFIFFPIFLLQLIHVRHYAESEYWISIVKVLLIVVFIFVGLIYDLNGIKGHPGPRFSNFHDGKPFPGLMEISQTFLYTFYAYGGIEFVSLAAGEAVKPHITVPRAFRATLFRIIIFYVLAILVIGLCISSKDPILLSSGSNAGVSPLTVVFQRAGFSSAVHLINAVLLTAVLSATNSSFYACSRMLLSLARSGHAPSILGWVTNNGVPVPALLVALAVSTMTSMTAVWGKGTVFAWLLNITGGSALLVWGSIGFISLRFRWACAAQRRYDFPYRQRFFPVLPIGIIAFTVVFLGAQGYAAVMQEPFAVNNIIAAYIGVVPYVLLYIGYILYERYISKPERRHGWSFVPFPEVDLDSDAVWADGEGGAVREQDARDAAARRQRRERKVYDTIEKFRLWMHISS